ncbi:hypothetical protein [Paenibacillus sp. CMAA1364]
MNIKKIIATLLSTALIVTAFPINIKAESADSVANKLKSIGVGFSGYNHYTGDYLSLEYNKYTNKDNYMLRGAFSGLGGWGAAGVNGGQMHNRAKGPNADVKDNQQIKRKASLTKMAGVFLNEFNSHGELNGPGSSTLGSGKEIIVELQAYDVDREKVDGKNEAGTGYTLLRRDSMNTPMVAALFDVTFNFQEFISAYSGLGSKLYTKEDAKRIEKRIDRTLDGYDSMAKYSMPDDGPLVNSDGKTSNGLFEVTDTSPGSAKYNDTYFHVPALVQKLGGIYEKDGAFPGKHKDDDYNAYTIYHMTPYPKFDNPGKARISTRQINGKTVNGVEFEYTAYGYSDRNVTGRIGLKDPNEIDTMSSDSQKVVAGNAQVLVDNSGTKRVNGKWYSL